MTQVLQYVILDENFEGYPCGQQYGGWIVSCDDWNDDVGGSGLASIKNNVKNPNKVIYIFASPLRRFYIELKIGLRYRSHYLGCCFDANVKLYMKEKTLLIRLRFDICSNKVILYAIDPSTNSILAQVEYITDLGQLYYSTKDSTLYYYYMVVTVGHVEGDTLRMCLCCAKELPCTSPVQIPGTFFDLTSIEITTETDAATADVDIHVDDVHIESDTPVNVYVQQTIPEYMVSLFNVMLYVMIVIVVTSLMFQLLTRLIDMFVGVSRW